MSREPLNEDVNYGVLLVSRGKLSDRNVVSGVIRNVWEPEGIDPMVPARIAKEARHPRIAGKTEDEVYVVRDAIFSENWYKWENAAFKQCVRPPKV